MSLLTAQPSGAAAGRNVSCAAVGKVTFEGGSLKASGVLHLLKHSLMHKPFLGLISKNEATVLKARWINCRHLLYCTASTSIQIETAVLLPAAQAGIKSDGYFTSSS